MISRALLPDSNNLQKPTGRDFIISLAAAYAFNDQTQHLVTTVPLLVVFAVCGKWIVGGVMQGAVKG